MIAPGAVLFDVGGTLLGEARFEIEAGFRAVMPEVPERAGELARAFLAELPEARREGRELPVVRWLRARLPPEESARLEDEQIEDRIRGAATGLIPLPGIDVVLARLDSDGVRAAAVSNSIFTARALSAELGRHGLGQLLEFVLSSADLGIRKPGAAMFDAALARLRVPASDAWFVGDSFAEDMVGAARVGLAPVWLSDGDQSMPPEPPNVTRVRSWADFLALYEAASERARPPRST